MAALRENPIIRTSDDNWDKNACYKPFAILDGDKWILWYNGRGMLEQIGVVFHDGKDLGFPTGLALVGTDMQTKPRDGFRAAPTRNYHCAQ